MSDDYTELHSDKVKVGECPACKFPLFGDVTLRSKLGKPYWVSAAVGGDQKVTVNSSVSVVAMSLTHSCGEGER